MSETPSSVIEAAQPQQPEKQLDPGMKAPDSPAALFKDPDAAAAAIDSASDASKPETALRALAEEVPQTQEQPQVVESERSLKDILRDESKSMKDRAWLDMNGCWGRGARGSLIEKYASMRDYDNAVFADLAAKVGKFGPLISNLQIEQTNVDDVIINFENQLAEIHTKIEEAEAQLKNEQLQDIPEAEIEDLLKGDAEQQAKANKILERNKLKKDESFLTSRRDTFSNRRQTISSLIDRWATES